MSQQFRGAQETEGISFPGGNPSNLNTSMSDEMREIEQKKATYMKHFIVDYLEHGLRKSVQQNALTCAKNVNYFRYLNEDLSNKEQRMLDSAFEKCLGKYSDSYEHALLAFNNHMQTQKKSPMLQHNIPLDSRERMEKAYMMGGDDAQEPVYDVPLTENYKPDFQMPQFDLQKTVGSMNVSSRQSPADMQQMPFNYYKEPKPQSNEGKKRERVLMAIILTLIVQRFDEQIV